jgi:hypothetical protein
LRQSGNHPLQQEEEEHGDVIPADMCFHLVSHFSLASIIECVAQNHGRGYKRN